MGVLPVRTLLFLVCVLLSWLVCSAGASLVSRVVVESRASVVVVSPKPTPSLTLHVWKDPAKSAALTEIDWGELEPGSSKNVTAYVEDAGTVPCVLSLATENWSSEQAATYIALVWDAEGAELQPGEMRQVVFTLCVAREISGVSAFSFDVVIWGSA